MQSSISSDIAVSRVTASGNKIGYPLLQRDVDYSNGFVNSNSDISFLILVLISTSNQVVSAFRPNHRIDFPQQFCRASNGRLCKNLL